ncbi:hypothetical protein [Actinopolymorpha alba]|uniref:hypothetical protein n=1 Tax=Actinopolymorpha alba TaxID=533267 RepID=UPI00037335F1|nr:hypothetical protein [Actinopolymorpha alba]
MTEVTIAHQPDAASRVRYGVDLLARALLDRGLQVEVVEVSWQARDRTPGAGLRVFVGSRSSQLVADLEGDETLLFHSGAPGDDGYYLAALPGRFVMVTGGNDTGVLYGCQELARIVRARGEIPRDLAVGETPHFVLRGPAVGLQKTTIEPPRQTYEYPVTHERFPWFYDRPRWLEFLDVLLEQRANVLYIWSGHPFSSFVRLEEYPEALEVTEAELENNRDLLRWLAAEADRRGIGVVLKFYNIHIPLPFAEHHGLPLLQTRPSPLVSDYTRKSLAAFVRTFPNVGLLVCLGETLHGDLYGEEWFVDTILAGVNDGLAASEISEPPPIILRAHAIDPLPVLERARHLYPRLWTMAKYNGESLTTWGPRGRWQQRHQALSARTDVHIVNVHVLANLEPFRYGAVSFIQRCVQAMRHRLGARGLHLYPLFYWDWPYAPDRTDPRLRQLDRDWIWFAAWHRYAWNPDRDVTAERDYWVGQLTARFGDAEAATAALDALEAIGNVAPLLVRRVGITEGNRQTLSLGMTMSQLINAQRYRPWNDLWESHAPNGERIETYVKREVHGEEHSGETPLDVAEDVEHFADKAVAAVDRGSGRDVKEAGEYAAICSDVLALAELAYFYAHRIRAAVQVCLYREAPESSRFRNIDLLRSAVVEVGQSVERFKKLVAITESTYLYANSMQTRARKVPFQDGATYRHWRDCLPLYERELANFTRNVELLAAGAAPVGRAESSVTAERYRPAEFTVMSAHAEPFVLTENASVFASTDANLRRVAEELRGLTGVRIRRENAIKRGVGIEIDLPEPAQVLIAYFQSPENVWLQPPDLEVASHADDRGGLEPVLSNAVLVDFHPRVNIHAVRFDAGRHAFDPGKGAYFIAGVVRADQQFAARNVVYGEDSARTMDWLFEDSEG